MTAKLTLREPGRVAPQDRRSAAGARAWLGRLSGQLSILEFAFSEPEISEVESAAISKQDRAVRDPFLG